MSQENVEKVRSSLDAWNRGDVDVWLEYAHPEIEWFSEVAQQFAGAETVYRGPEELRRYWDEWHSLWEVAIEVSDIHDAGDTVVALARMSARGEASGISLERPMGYVFEFDGGLARTVRSYLDPAQALEAAGLAG